MNARAEGGALPTLPQRAVACPICDAPAGEPCFEDADHFDHLSRYALARNQAVEASRAKHPSTQPTCYLCGTVLVEGAEWPNDVLDIGDAQAHSGCLADFEDSHRRDEPAER